MLRVNKALHGIQSKYHLPQIENCLFVEFPNVIGAIDGTLITIRKFNTKNRDYISRREKCELNILIVCGPDHLIYYCSARLPGAVNDSRMFRESHLREILENGKKIVFILAIEKC